ncbi:MAG: YbaN family protein [Pseudomonadota bacterium]
MKQIQIAIAWLGKPFWFTIGVLALALGVIGVVLPVLPTTPFVILAAFAFAKGSPRLARLLEEHKVFGPIIEDWKENGAIAPKYKAISVAMMGFAILLSVGIGLPGRVVAIQAVCILFAALFILSRPNGPMVREGQGTA